MELASKRMKMTRLAVGLACAVAFAFPLLGSVNEARAQKPAALATITAVQPTLSPEEIKVRVSSAFAEIKQQGEISDPKQLALYSEIEVAVFGVATQTPVCVRDITVKHWRGCRPGDEKVIPEYPFSTGDDKFAKKVLKILKGALAGIQRLVIRRENATIVVENVTPAIDDLGCAHESVSCSGPIAQNTENPQ